MGALPCHGDVGACGRPHRAFRGRRRRGPRPGDVGAGSAARGARGRGSARIRNGPRDRARSRGALRRLDIARLLPRGRRPSPARPAGGRRWGLEFADLPLSSGSRVGPYEIIGPLGAGGMGEVYRARDTRLGREVAIKVLPSALSSDAGRRARFEQEARATAALNHPNIVAVFDVGQLPDPPSEVFLVSELVPGETLAAFLERGTVPIKKLLDLAVQIADGMAAAHAARITHRDLKPANIIVTPEGPVKILDFGLAKQAALADTA